MKEKNYVASVRQDSNDNCDAPFKFQNTIELLTALLSGKVLLRNDGDSERTQILWCEYLNNKPYFFVNGWGSAFGSAMDRVIGIIETNGAGWRIDLPTPEGSVATESSSSTEADKPLPNSPVKEDEQKYDASLKALSVILNETIYNFPNNDSWEMINNECRKILNV